MFMRITKGHVLPGCWDAYEAAYRLHVEGNTPTQGLLGRWLLRSKTSPELGFSLSLWETRADMEAYERSDAVKREILPHLATWLAGDSVAHHCEVTLHEMRKIEGDDPYDPAAFELALPPGSDHQPQD